MTRLSASSTSRAGSGPPDFDGLLAEVTRVHAAGRPVAIHAVTRESAVVALAALDEAGTVPGDRLEHAAIIGRDLLPMLARLNPVVVTQPGFATERGEQYRRDVPEADQARHPCGQRLDLGRDASEGVIRRRNGQC